MLTGDSARTAEAIRRQAGIETVIAEVLPDGKEQEVRRLQEQGRKVAMVGDGINDAPALARADVGMAIGAGTDVAIESADIVLMKGDLRDVATAVRLSRAVIRNIKENLFWALCYNSLGIPLAAGVFYAALQWKLNPMFGAAAMSLSSICVVMNALRLRFFKAGHAASCPTGACPIAARAAEQPVAGKHPVVLRIEGMSCSHCTGRVTQALAAIGVQAEVTLDPGMAKAEVSAEITDKLLKKTVEEAGYKVVDIEHPEQ